MRSTKRKLAWVGLCALGLQAQAFGAGPDPAYPPVMVNRCYNCHGLGGEAEGRFSMNLSPDALVKAGLLDPEHPENSLIYQRPSRGEMPPDPIPHLNGNELGEIRSWIGSMKAAPVVPLSNTALSRDQVYKKMRAVMSASSSSAADGLRFFSLVEEKRAGRTDEELNLYRQALARTLNSLTWKPRLVQPAPVDGSGLLLSVNIKDLGWDPEDWQALFADLCGPGAADSPEVRIPSDLDPDGRCPVVPVGKFVASALDTASYDTLIWRTLLGRLATEAVGPFTEIGHKGASILFDSLFGLSSEGIPTASFSESGVTLNNRLLARAATAYGYLWGSRDFLERNGATDLRLKPEAVPDAGEFIFSLPNGMQGYFILNQDGRLIQSADVRIARDPLRVDHVVAAPASCISCHGNLGINARTEGDAIPSTVSPFSKLKPWFAADSQNYQQALQKIGAARTDSTEPVTAVLQRTLRSRYIQTGP